MFPPDFKELLSDLNSQSARYLIIGGYAVGVHSQPRATKDLDIFIRPDPENGKAVYAALAKFGAPLQGVSPEDLIDKGSFFRIGHAPLMVDVLAHISGVDFESAWDSRVEVEIDSGLRVPVISSEDLIKAKLAAGRDRPPSLYRRRGKHHQPLSGGENGVAVIRKLCCAAHQRGTPVAL
jgi:hypothetical protein